MLVIGGKIPVSTSGVMSEHFIWRSRSPTVVWMRTVPSKCKIFFSVFLNSPLDPETTIPCSALTQIEVISASCPVRIAKYKEIKLLSWMRPIFFARYRVKQKLEFASGEWAPLELMESFKSIWGPETPAMIELIKQAVTRLSVELILYHVTHLVELEFLLGYCIHQLLFDFGYWSAIEQRCSPDFQRRYNNQRIN